MCGRSLRLTINIGPKVYFRAPVPHELMNIVRCNCKQLSVNQCGSNLSSCCQNGLSCLSACGGCRGIGCYNGTADTKGYVSDDHLENYCNLFENSFVGVHNFIFLRLQTGIQEPCHI